MSPNSIPNVQSPPTPHSDSAPSNAPQALGETACSASSDLFSWVDEYVVSPRSLIDKLVHRILSRRFSGKGFVMFCDPAFQPCDIGLHPTHGLSNLQKCFFLLLQVFAALRITGCLEPIGIRKSRNKGIPIRLRNVVRENLMVRGVVIHRDGILQNV